MTGEIQSGVTKTPETTEAAMCLWVKAGDSFGLAWGKLTHSFEILLMIIFVLDITQNCGNTA